MAFLHVKPPSYIFRTTFSLFLIELGVGVGFRSDKEQNCGQKSNLAHIF